MFGKICLLTMAFALATVTAVGQTTEQGQKEQANEKLDASAINQFVAQKFLRVSRTYNSDPEAAAKILDDVDKFFETAEPKNDEAQKLLDRAKLFVRIYRDRIALAQVTVEQLVQRLNENPNDAKVIERYAQKLVMEINPLVRSDATAAEEKLNAAKDYLESLKERSEEAATERAIAAAVRLLSQLDSSIASEKKKTELIGNEAAPLAVEAWVNGSPLSDEDLKGKVVLLDFWAVWCGPCIATFPHLREWHEQYADRGLVIIGLTRYYNYGWDAETGRATKQEDITPEQEQEMLVHFAEHHQLHHRFAIQSGREMSDYYGVSGIPHVVVIDRENKVRMMRVGSGSQNAEDVGELLSKLIGESSAGD